MRWNFSARYPQIGLPNCSRQRGAAGHWGRRPSSLQRPAQMTAKCGRSRAVDRAKPLVPSDVQHVPNC